jgi:methylmalonyl-CoA/ethylmalonyl-CoA epimerase
LAHVRNELFGSVSHSLSNWSYAMANQVGSTLTRIGQIAVPVKDVERATTFYRDTLGMQHLFSIPGSAFFQCGDIRLMLSAPEKPEFDHPSSILYFVVDDLNATYMRLVEGGVHFDDEPHLIANMETYDLWMVFFRDSEHNYMGLMSEVPHT